MKYKIGDFIRCNIVNSTVVEFTKPFDNAKEWLNFEIVGLSEKEGTYVISVEPYPQLCTDKGWIIRDLEAQRYGINNHYLGQHAWAVYAQACGAPLVPLDQHGKQVAPVVEDQPTFQSIAAITNKLLEGLKLDFGKVPGITGHTQGYTLVDNTLVDGGHTTSTGGTLTLGLGTAGGGWTSSSVIIDSGDSITPVAIDGPAGPSSEKQTEKLEKDVPVVDALRAAVERLTAEAESTAKSKMMGWDPAKKTAVKKAAKKVAKKGAKQEEPMQAVVVAAKKAMKSPATKRLTPAKQVKQTPKKTEPCKWCNR